MAQSLAQVYLHIVFSTKNRTPFLQNKVLRNELHAYLAGICKKMDSPSLQVGGIEDHVHILCRLSRRHGIMSITGELKKGSSKWIKERDSALSKFYWQNGYGAFSVSPSHITALRKYIANQEGHHRKETFQEEFLRLLNKYGIQYDERYLWD